MQPWNARARPSGVRAKQFDADQEDNMQATSQLKALLIAHEICHGIATAEVAEELRIQEPGLCIEKLESGEYQASRDPVKFRIASEDQLLRMTVAGPMGELGFWEFAFENKTIDDFVAKSKERGSKEWIAHAIRGRCVSVSDTVRILGKPVDSKSLYETIIRAYANGTRLIRHAPLLLVMRGLLEAGHPIHLNRDALVKFSLGEGEFEACLPADVVALYQATQALQNQDEVNIDILIS